jgi:N-acetylneuraminate synthase
MNFKELSKPYLIGEIGINHNGDIQIAKKLIDAGFATSWDCVKFQKRNPDVAVPDHQKGVMRETPWGKMTYLDYKYKVEFEKEEFDFVNKYCKEKPIDWTASVWDQDSLDFLLKYNVPFVKIPSAHITNDELLIATAKSGIPIIASTGMSTLEEVDHAVNLLEKHANSYAIMHTNSSYPSKLEDLNLSLIPFFIKRYECVVGYSGHEFGLTPTVIAASLGARIIERHITIDRNLWGTDQSSSVEIEGMDSLYKRLKEVKLILGSPEKIVTLSELPIRKKLRG